VTRRNVGNNPALHNFIGKFRTSPMADGAFFWLLASSRDDLASLFCDYLDWSSWTGEIFQAFDTRKLFLWDRLQTDPAPTPRAYGIDAQPKLPGNLRISFSFRCC